MIGSDIPPGISAPTALPVGPSACKTKSAPPRRSSQIELAPSGILESETVDMRMTLPKRAEETIDFVGRGTGQGTVNYPIHDLNWRGGIIAHEETQWYADAVAKLGDYSLTAFGEIIRLGNQMAMVAVGYRLAARELQELNFRKRSHVTARIEDMQHVFPAIAPQLIDISRRGMIPGYRGAAPPEKRVTRYPYVPDDAEKIAKKLWKDIRMGIVVVCDTELAEDSGLVISHASSAVRKKNPDRTLSVDYRILSDLRQINLGNHKEDFYPVEVVRLSEIISRILKLTRQFPTLPVLMTKRDIASASRRILLRPVLVQIFTTDIPGSAFARNSDVFFGHLAMPFGWVASPAYFKLHTDAISAMHHYYRPDRCLLSGGERFSSFMYVGDCMLIECPVGNRLKASVECWEWACKQILDDDSINLEKKRIEGNWSQTATLLGFEINTAEMSAQLPAEKIEQARVLVLTDELAPVNYGVTVKTLKQLRGLCAHWLNCNLFWHFLCQPIDLLLSHASESGAMICCGETEIWLSFFNALTLTRSMAESESDWGMLFKCGLERLQVMHERLSGTVENPDAVWTSGDATMAKMAGVNWRRKEFPQLAPEDLLADFHQGQLRAYNIGEIELMTAVGIAVFWADIWKGRQIILLVTDNQNTFSWLGDRSAKKGLALRAVATFHIWCVENGIEVYPFIYEACATYDRTSSHESRDTKCADGRSLPVSLRRKNHGGGRNSWHVRRIWTGWKTGRCICRGT